jgi:ribosomal protein S27E/predicted nucleic acid-binding Zn ribbon protein
MSITVKCPSCGQRTKAPDSAAGKVGKCPRCGNKVLVPQANNPIFDAEVVDAEVVDADVVDAEVVEPPAKPKPVEPPTIGLKDDEPEPVERKPAEQRIIPPAPRKREVERPAPIPLNDTGIYAHPQRNAPDEVDETKDRRPCPVCGEMIPNNALKCRFCDEILDPKLKKQEAKKRRRSSGRGGDYDDDMTTGDWVVAILCSGIGCIAGIIWLIQGKRKGTQMLIVSLCMAVVWNILRFVIEYVIENNR